VTDLVVVISHVFGIREVDAFEDSPDIRPPYLGGGIAGAVGQQDDYSAHGSPSSSDAYNYRSHRLGRKQGWLNGTLSEGRSQGARTRQFDFVVHDDVDRLNELGPGLIAAGDWIRRVATKIHKICTAWAARQAYAQWLRAELCGHLALLIRTVAKAVIVPLGLSARLRNCHGDEMRYIHAAFGSIDGLARYHRPYASSGVLHVALSTRDQVNMSVSNSLPSRIAVIHTNVEGAYRNIAPNYLQPNLV
jgi:hypothetical protein